MDGCKNNPEKESTVKEGEHIPSVLLMSTIFKDIENKHDVYRGKDCMKTFCVSLKEQAKKIINFKKKKMELLTNEQQESYEKVKICYISKRSLKINILKKIW